MVTAGADVDAFPSSRADAEAVLTVDAAGLISFASPNAAEVLGVPGLAAGQPLSAVDLRGRLGELVRGPGEVHGTVRARGRYLQVRRLVARAGAAHTIVLVRDRTETVELFAELADLHAVLVGLRTGQHENANRLHVVLGFLQAGEYESAIGYLKELVGIPFADPGDAVPVGAATAGVAALLSTKASIAVAAGVQLRYGTAGDLRPLDRLGLDADTLASIVGNLVDNAIDAAIGTAAATVELRVVGEATEVTLTVRDSGPGVPAGVDVFADGYTTKRPRVGMPRGFGLALVRHLVARSAGTVSAHNDGGAVFTVRWPTRAY